MTQTNDPQIFIDTILKNRQTQIEDANEKTIEARKANMNLLLESMKEYFGDFWPVINEHGKPAWSFDASNIPNLVIEIPALEYLQLAPIRVVLKGTKVNPTNYNPPFLVYGNSFGLLVDAIAHARDTFAEYKADVMKEKIKKAKQGLWTGHRDEEKARQAHQSLLEIDPANKEEWDSELNAWLKSRDEWNQRDAESKAGREAYALQEKRREQAMAERVQVLLSYLKDKALIIQANEILAKAIQERFNQPYTEYKLIYGAVALDQDTEEKFVEQLSVYTLQSAPDETGRWMVDGHPTIFYHPISLATLVTTPEKGMLRRRVKVGGVEIFFSPLISENTVERAVSQIIEIPNPPPYTGEDLTGYQAEHECMRQAQYLLSKENGTEDIDY